MRQQELPATGVGKRKANRFVVGVVTRDGGRELDDKVLGAAVTYQRELVKCGKPNCRSCSKGPGHGPYIYAYWSDLGRTRALYIGKVYRPALEVLVRRRTNNQHKGYDNAED